MFMKVLEISYDWYYIQDSLQKNPDDKSFGNMHLI